MLTVDDVLSIRHPDSPEWSPSGDRIAFAYTVDGVRELWVAGTGEGDTPTRVSGEGQAVSSYGWLGVRLLYACGDTVYAVGASSEPQVLYRGQSAVIDVACGPDGRRLALGRAQASPLILDGGRVREASLPGPAIPGIAWSPSGRRVALPFLRDGRMAIVVEDAGDGEAVWESPESTATLLAGDFVGEDRLVFLRESFDCMWAEYVLADLVEGREHVLERVETEHGLGVVPHPVASPDGSAVAVTVPVEGWLHVVVHDLRDGTRTVPLPGAHEDLGHEAERVAFSPDSRSLVFTSSKGALQQRQLWRYDLDTRAVRPLTDERGTHTDPVWSPDGSRIACVYGGPRHSVEVTVLDVADGGSKRRLTQSMPAAWAAPGAIFEPTHVLLTSADGARIHADLWLPQAPRGDGRVPGLVYVHGGPTRQMRDGFHPMHPYAVFYAYNQYLVSRGYAVISVDYRGGTGYGVDYERGNYLSMAQKDMEDCIAGAEHLAALPQVDPARIAIWGLSYGGYMTLAALAKRPEVFALGINIAGLWDMEQWLAWMKRRHPGHPLYFARRLGGFLPDGDAEAHRQASPRNFVQGLRAPLLNLHGTADANVDFEQLDEIIRDCTEAGKDFAALYYPDEAHMFTRRTTWEDAFRRMESAFERYLRCDPAARPPAMI